MTAHHWWIPPGETSWVEITNSVIIETWGTEDKAEEGSIGQMNLTVQDPALAYNFTGHRPWRITEDEISGDDQVIYQGYIWNQKISRGEGVSREVHGRTWNLTIQDANVLWARRVMLGSDCKRDDETDVERVQWLLTTNEAAEFDDVTSYVSTDDPVDMDGGDLRGQMFNQIMDDCAQQSGKNWFAWVMWSASASDYIVDAWYGDDALDAYTSNFSLSNDPADVDDDEMAAGTATVWSYSDDTDLDRDPSRVFSSAVVPYPKGYGHATNDETVDNYARRDSIQPATNVRSKARADARARRYTRQSNEQEEVITTTVELPAAKVNETRPGLLIPFKATHLEFDGVLVTDFSEYVSCRIMSRQLRQTAAGAKYRCRLELAAPRKAAVSSGVGGSVFAVLDYAHGPFANNLVRFEASGDNPPGGWPTEPTTGLLTPQYDTEQRPYTGIEVNGDGTLDTVEFTCSTVGVLAGSYTVVWAITVNGAIVASVSTYPSGSLVGYADKQTVTATSLSVSNGDIVAAYLSCTPAMPFFRTPAGTGQGGEVLKITGGSLS